MVVHIDHRRVTLITAISDEFMDVICDLSTEELEKLYNHFVTYNVGGMKVSFNHENAIFGY